MMEKEDFIALKQMTSSLTEILGNMEKTILEENANEFNKLRKLFIQIQGQIVEHLK